MKTVTYKCDRCKDEDTDNTINLEVVKVVQGMSNSKAFALASVDWCLKCRVVMGIVNPSYDKKVTPKDPPPTLEEIIREIVREEIDNG